MKGWEVTSRSVFKSNHLTDCFEGKFGKPQLFPLDYFFSCSILDEPGVLFGGRRVGGCLGPLLDNLKEDIVSLMWTRKVVQIALHCSYWRQDKVKMSLGAERRMENRLRQLEAMIKEPRSAINLESLLVSSPSFSWMFNAPRRSVA